VHGKLAIPADTALRQSRALGLTDMFWIINATEALTSKAGSQGRTATRRVAVIVYSPPMTGNRPESLGSHWGLETVKSVVAGRNGTNQRSQDARFGNPLFGGSVCIKNVGTKIAVTMGANDDNSSGSTHV